ncbi:PAAR domain-containing protein [Serratia inhibens]|uniref:PAAR domain-containing protein n=1 Tax=Serratia inhibens TaxID=2338073 RepID=UPI003D2DABF8
MAVGHFLFQDDKTSCGGVITEGMPDHLHFGRLQACEEHSVTCGKHPGFFKIMGGLPDDFIHGRRIAGTLHSRSTCPCRAEFIPSIYTDTYEFIPQQSKGGNNSTDLDNPVNVGPPVFAKSCLRPVGCTDAGTHEEP